MNVLLIRKLTVVITTLLLIDQVKAVPNMINVTLRNQTGADCTLKEYELRNGFGSMYPQSIPKDQKISFHQQANPSGFEEYFTYQCPPIGDVEFTISEASVFFEGQAPTLNNITSKGVTAVTSSSKPSSYLYKQLSSYILVDLIPQSVLEHVPPSL